MFNLARRRGIKPGETEKEKLLKVVHKEKLKNRKASVEDDAGNIALLCAQTDQDPASIMDDEYWTWVKEHDKGYYRDVVKKAKVIARQMEHEAENPSPKAKYVPPAPIPKQKPGGEGGMPAMASRPVMFLKRNDGRYRLMGTLAGDLLSGKLPLLDDEGNAFFMKVKDDASVDRFGPSAIEALKIQESLPDAMRSAAVRYLSSLDLADARPLARSIVTRYLRKKKLDMLPLSVELKGERFAFLLRLGLEPEPDECQALREEMGRAITPVVSRLRDAMLMDGVEIEEVPAPMPLFTPQGKKASQGMELPFGDASSSPSSLSADDVDDSIDVPSLVMTISSPDTDDETRESATRRLVEIICRLPAIYERYELSEADLKSIASACGASPAVERLSSFVRLFRADDAELMSSYSESEEDRSLIASLVGNQGRRNIIDAVPEMSRQGDAFVPEFLEAIDPEKGASFIESLVMPGDGMFECPEKIISRKIIESIWKNPLGTIVPKALDSFPMARDFAILTIFVEDGVGEAIKAMEKIPGFQDDKSWHGTLLASACAKTGDEKAMKLAYFITGATPSDVMEFAGRRAAAWYMRANRIGPDGDPIPEASEILSAPEDPLPLAKSLNAMGDHQAMLILLRACARRARRGFAKDMWYAVSFMADALRASGQGDAADKILSTIGVRIDDDSGTIKRVPRTRKVATRSGATLVGKDGVYVRDGVAYACDAETAASLEDFGVGEEKM